jgi:hypothetical protein
MKKSEVFAVFVAITMVTCGVVISLMLWDVIQMVFPLIPVMR